MCMMLKSDICRKYKKKKKKNEESIINEIYVLMICFYKFV